MCSIEHIVRGNAILRGCRFREALIIYDQGLIVGQCLNLVDTIDLLLDLGFMIFDPLLELIFAGLLGGLLLRCQLKCDGDQGNEHHVFLNLRISSSLEIRMLRSIYERLVLETAAELSNGTKWSLPDTNLRSP